MLIDLARRVLAPLNHPQPSEWERATEWFAGALPDWTSLLAGSDTLWSEAKRAARGPDVLIGTAIGGLPQMAIVDTLLAAALTLRGARVSTLLCDTALPACFFPAARFYPRVKEFSTHGPAALVCAACEAPGHRVFEPLGLPILRYGSALTADDRRRAHVLAQEPHVDGIPGLQFEGVPIGDHAIASAIRFFASADLQREREGERVLRRYLEAAYLSLFGMRRIFSDHHFDCVSTMHGIYVPHGLVVEAAHEADVRVVCWCPMYRKQTVVFSHNDTYHQTFLNEPTSAWDQLPWTPGMQAELQRYLKARWYGTEDWFKFINEPEGDIAAIQAAIGIDFSEPTVGLLTNVIWDAQVHYAANAFANMMEWLLYTIHYFETRPEVQLLIRVHPGEITGGTPTRQPVIEELMRAIPQLPPNVFIIPPESPISTYAAMGQCDSVLIYGTKTGIELAAVGIPVVVAGEAWVRNKGISIDVSSVQEYCAALDRLPLRRRMSLAEIERAQKYAYHFFFRRWLPLSILDASKEFYRVGIERLEDLLPGRSPGLDIICDGILTGSDFIYPAERFAQTVTGVAS